MQTKSLSPFFLAAVLLSGCALSPFEADERPLITAQSSVARVNAGADLLAQDIYKARHSKSRILVTPLVRVDSLRTSSSMGRLVGEQTSARLAFRGLKVADVKFRNSPYESNDKGALSLSEAIKELAALNDAKLVVTGSYALTGAYITVNLKAVEVVSEKIVAGATYTLPKIEFTGALD